MLGWADSIEQLSIDLTAAVNDGSYQEVSWLANVLTEWVKPIARSAAGVVMGGLMLTTAATGHANDVVAQQPIITQCVTAIELTQDRSESDSKREYHEEKAEQELRSDLEQELRQEEAPAISEVTALQVQTFPEGSEAKLTEIPGHVNVDGLFVLDKLPDVPTPTHVEEQLLRQGAWSTESEATDVDASGWVEVGGNRWQAIVAG